MHKAKFANGREVESRWFEEGAEFYDGQTRRVLTIHFYPPDLSFEDLSEIVSSEENTSIISKINDAVDIPVLDKEGNVKQDNKGNPVMTTTTAVDMFTDYSLRLKVGIEPIVIGQDEETGLNIMTDMYVVKLARLFPHEIQQKAMGKRLAEFEEVLKKAKLM